MSAAAGPRQRGFTLLELVAVMLVIAIASVPLLGLFSGASLGLLDDTAIQTATQLAQERAETLLAVRRVRGYGDAEVSTDLVENLGGNYSGFTRTTTITPLTGSPCPGAAGCKQVEVRVEQGGRARAALAFMLVNY